MVVSVLLLEPPRLGFITRPTKRCLPLQFAVAILRFAGLCLADALQLSAPCSFRFWLAIFCPLMPYETRKRTSVLSQSPMIAARCLRSLGHDFGKQ